MVSIKSVLDAVGSSGGVAWSIFNTLFATLGLATGGGITGLIGLLSCILFLVVGIPTFYFSYQEEKQNSEELKQLLEQRMYIVSAYLGAYVQGILKQYYAENKDHNFEKDEFIFYLQNTIVKDGKLDRLERFFFGKKLLLNISSNESLLEQIFFAMREKKPFIIDEDGQIFQFTQLISKKSPPATYLLIKGFRGFIGGFGTIAGGSGGFAGLLIGLGLFSGFSAFPLVGLISLGSSLVIGAAVAGEVIDQAKRDYEDRLVIDSLKDMSKALKTLWEERQLTNAIRFSQQPTAKKYVSEDALFKIEKEVKYVCSLKETIKVSFFKPSKQQKTLQKPLDGVPIPLRESLVL